MSTIVQQPDALSFSGNLKKFLVSSTADVSVQLAKGATQLLDEVYAPGEGDLVEIDLRKIIHQELSVSIPTDSEIVTEQTDAIAEFTATIDEVDVVFTVVKGGVFRLKDTPYTWLASHNQSWQPLDKEIVYDQLEWLSRYATEKLWVRGVAYFTDGSTEDFELAIIEAGSVYSINCSYAVIDALLTGSQPVAWDVKFLDNSGAQLGYTQRYRLRTKTEWEHPFVWANTLGGIDSVSFTGARDEDQNIEHLVAVYDDESIEEYDEDRQREFKQNTGTLDKYHAKWLKDFFLSPEKYEIDSLGDLYRVALVDSEVKVSEEDDLFTYELTFRLSDERPLLNIERTTSLSVFTAGAISLPSLISDLPLADADGNWIVIVQDPDTNNYYQLTIDQLLQLFVTNGGSTGTATEPDGFTGSIVYVSGLTYKSVNLVATINGVKYPVIDQKITLPDADPNLPRKDIFVVDTYSNLLSIQGDPAADPLKPTPGPNQIEITHADIGAAAIVPSNVLLDKVYDEGDPEEWSSAYTADDDITVNMADAAAAQNGSIGASITLAIPDATGEAPTHAIGDEYQGGIIFYIEPGSNGKKGLIAAKADVSGSAQYQSGAHSNGTQTGIDIGYGWPNTLAMMAHTTSNQAGMAAPLCRYYQGGGYSDWFLPCRGELDLMRFYKSQIGGFTNDRYWSSTEAISDSSVKAYGIDFSKSNGWFKSNKTDYCRIRPVRKFDDTQQSYTTPVEVYSPTNTKIEFTAPATRELNAWIPSFWMKTSKAWLGNTALMIETYYNGVKTGGVMIQAANSVGFDANNTDDWQQVVIQGYNFALTTKQCDKLVIRLINSWPNGVVLQIDGIRIQTDPEQEEADPDYGYRANSFDLTGAGPHAIQFQNERLMPDTKYFPLVKAFQDGFEVGYASIVKRIDGFDITFNEGGTHTGEYLILKYY